MNRLIVGCGFLGHPLAVLWANRPSQGRTFATTRSPQRGQELAQEGIEPLVLDVTDASSVQESVDSLPPIDTIVWAVGMDRSQYSDIYDVYVGGLKRFIAAYRHPIEHFIYVSSTGVYGDFQGDWIDESAPTRPARDGGKACLEAEQLIASHTDRWTVLRMAGLYGGNRIPTKQLIQDRNWDRLSPLGYLNLIHQTDAVAAIDATASLQPTQEIILCSDGHPPLRSEYYQYIATQFGFGKIDWPTNPEIDPQSRSANSKRISNQKMLERLKLKLIHPNYRSGLAGVF